MEEFTNLNLLEELICRNTERTADTIALKTENKLLKKQLEEMERLKALLDFNRIEY